MTHTVIAIIDDEALALKATEGAVCEALPQAEIFSFLKCSELLAFAAERQIDIAFLDINMRGMTGLELARRLEQINPKINIIFVTGFNDYKSEAMDLHASGYLMKPVLAEDITNEMQYLRHPLGQAKKQKVTVKCFGNFSVSFDGAPARFKYSKTCELFAYLVDRQGAMISQNELCAVLWEDNARTGYIKKLIADLKHTFGANGCLDVINSGRGVIGINADMISCDYYDYIGKVPGSSGLFRGEYMTQYSWAEVTLANLLNDKASV